MLHPHQYPHDQLILLLETLSIDEVTELAEQWRHPVVAHYSFGFGDLEAKILKLRALASPADLLPLRSLPLPRR